VTDAQRVTLMAEWWPNACAVQGWQSKDRELRLRVLSFAVSYAFEDQQQFLELLNSEAEPPRVLESASDLNGRGDIDAVKACLLMLADNLKGAGEVGRPDVGRARRLRAAIRAQVKCIALYHLNAEGLLAKIIRDKFKAGSRAMPLTLDDLTAAPIGEKPSQLDQVIRRLGGILHNKKTGLRVRAGDSIHDMNLLAGVNCSCKRCAGVRLVVMEQPF